MFLTHCPRHRGGGDFQSKKSLLKAGLRRLPKAFALSLIASITLLGATPNNQDLNKVIENKITNCGVLTFTQKEIAKALIQRLIARKNSFVLTDLDNREKVIEMLEKIFEENDIKYKIAKEPTPEDKWEEIAFDATLGAMAGASAGAGVGSIPGGIIGGIARLAYGAWSVADDVTGGIFSSTPDCKMVQLKDKKQIRVEFMKKEEEKK